MPKIRMNAHVVVSEDGEWMVFGWSGNNERPSPGNRKDMHDCDLWESGDGERSCDITFEVDVPEPPKPTEVIVDASAR